jgi:hypothetical protein
MQVCLRDDEIEKLKMLMEEGKGRKGKDRKGGKRG